MQENLSNNRSNLLSKVDMQQQNIKRIGKNRYKVIGGKGGTIKLHLPKQIRDKYDDFYLTMKIREVIQIVITLSLLIITLIIDCLIILPIEQV